MGRNSAGMGHEGRRATAHFRARGLGQKYRLLQGWLKRAYKYWDVATSTTSSICLYSFASGVWKDCLGRGEVGDGGYRGYALDTS
jgi:hypothetical protein